MRFWTQANPSIFNQATMYINKPPTCTDAHTETLNGISGGIKFMDIYSFIISQLGLTPVWAVDSNCEILKIYKKYIFLYFICF